MKGALLLQEKKTLLLEESNAKISNKIQTLKKELQDEGEETVKMTCESMAE
jgi:hypothetical protein